MKSPFLVVFGVVVLSSAVASAEPDRLHAAPAQSSGFVALDAMAAFSRYLETGLALEGGLHLGSVVYGHGFVSVGQAITVMDRGSFETARVGVEARTCLPQLRVLCGFAGADLGVEHSKVMEEGVTDPTTTIETAMLVVPRVGIELGKSLRVRGAVEAPVYLASATKELGGMLTLGLAYTF